MEKLYCSCNERYPGYARLAQLVERPLDVGKATGSNPVSRTLNLSSELNSKFPLCVLLV